MNRVDVGGGVGLYVEDFGEGPPILFIAGGNCTHKSWESQVAALAGRYRTVTFDWRGTGASDKPRAGYTGEAAAGDVHALIAQLGLAPVVLVGHGLGAHLALLTAFAHPNAVRGLVLASAAPWFSGERNAAVGGVPDEFLRFMISTRRGAAGQVPYAEICHEMGDKWIFHNRQSPGTCQAVLDQALEWPQYVLDCYAASMRNIDHRPRLGTLRCPTLVIQGRHDRKQRYEGGVLLAQAIPGATLVTLEHSATMGNLEEVDAFNGAIDDFMRALPAQRDAA